MSCFVQWQIRIIVWMRKKRNKCASNCSWCSHVDICPTYGWEWGPAF